MTPRKALLAAAVALAAPAHAQAPAQTPAQPAAIPAAAQGLWASGACADPAALLFVTERYWALLPKEGTQELWRSSARLRCRRLHPCHRRRSGTDTASVRADGSRLETRTPGPKQTDDQLPQNAPATQWARCPALPPALAALHGEGLSFLGALDGIEAACSGGDTAACLGAVFAWADVTRDGVLSVAEIARLVRGATHMAMLATGAELSDLAAALGVAALGGLAAAHALLASLDFDGSGTLSQAELLQDRSPVPGLSGPAAPPGAAAAGPPLGAAALAGQLGALKTLLDQLGPMLGLPQR
jgi:hypothetical protein